MAGTINMNSNSITNLQESNTLTDAISKNQVDIEPYKPAISVTSDPAPAIVNETYLVDVSGGPATVTLPTSPAEGSKVTVLDKVGLASVNNITVAAGPGNSIQGDRLMNLDNATMTLVYSTNIWYQVRNTKVSVIQAKNLYAGNYIGLQATNSVAITANVQTTIPWDASAYINVGNLVKNVNAVSVLAGRLYKISLSLSIYATATHDCHVVGSVSGNLIPAISAAQAADTRSGIQRTQVYFEPTVNEDLSVVMQTTGSSTSYKHRLMNVIEIQRSPDLNVMQVYTGTQSTILDDAQVPFDTVLFSYGSEFTFNPVNHRVYYNGPIPARFYIFFALDIATNTADTSPAVEYTSKYIAPSGSIVNGNTIHGNYPTSSTYVFNNSCSTEGMIVTSQSGGYFTIIYSYTAGSTSGTIWRGSMEIIRMPA